MMRKNIYIIHNKSTCFPNVWCEIGLTFPAGAGIFVGGFLPVSMVKSIRCFGKNVQKKNCHCGFSPQ